MKTVADKRSRLITLSDLIKRGKIKFPRKGAEMLIRQIVDFGSEPHDDLMDAFTFIAHHVIEKDKPRPGIVFLGGTPRQDPFGGTWDVLYRGPNYKF